MDTWWNKNLSFTLTQPTTPRYVFSPRHDLCFQFSLCNNVIQIVVYLTKIICMQTFYDYRIKLYCWCLYISLHDFGCSLIKQLKCFRMQISGLLVVSCICWLSLFVRWLAIPTPTIYVVKPNLYLIDAIRPHPFLPKPLNQ